jgi:trans-aconitate methyltransferase
MKAYNDEQLTAYLKDDYILALLEAHPEDAQFASHRWLLTMPAKRMIWADVYGALLTAPPMRILDVGGGFSALTRELKKQHDYTLLETLAHDASEVLKQIESDIGPFIEQHDWADFSPTLPYDLVIANDLFPNVDQRLEMFIAKFRPHAKNMLLTLTAYDTPRYYRVQRVDTEESLTVKMWGSEDVERALMRTGVSEPMPLLHDDDNNLFPNKRKVYRLDI